MGQKISPEIFKLEKNNDNWKSKYTENKRKEMSAFFFKSLEIKKFIKRFLRFHGLAFHNCKLTLSNTSLNLFISFYTTKHSTVVVDRENEKNNYYCNDNNITKAASRLQKKIKLFMRLKTLIKIYCRCFRTTRIFRTRKFLKKNRKPKIYNELRKFKKK